MLYLWGLDNHANGIRPATMMAFLKLLREQYGGAEGYVVQKCGLTKEEVEKIRENLTEDMPPIHTSF